MKISLKSGLNQNKRDSEVTEKEERQHRANRVQLKSSKPRTPSPERKKIETKTQEPNIRSPIHQKSTPTKIENYKLTPSNLSSKITPTSLLTNSPSPHRTIKSTGKRLFKSDTNIPYSKHGEKTIEEDTEKHPKEMVSSPQLYAHTLRNTITLAHPYDKNNNTKNTNRNTNKNNDKSEKQSRREKREDADNRKKDSADAADGDAGAGAGGRSGGKQLHPPHNERSLLKHRHQKHLNPFLSAKDNSPSHSNHLPNQINKNNQTTPPDFSENNSNIKKSSSGNDLANSASKNKLLSRFLHNDCPFPKEDLTLVRNVYSQTYDYRKPSFLDVVDHTCHPHPPKYNAPSARPPSGSLTSRKPNLQLNSYDLNLENFAHTFSTIANPFTPVSEIGFETLATSSFAERKTIYSKDYNKELRNSTSIGSAFEFGQFKKLDQLATLQLPFSPRVSSSFCQRFSNIINTKNPQICRKLTQLHFKNRGQRNCDRLKFNFTQNSFNAPKIIKGNHKTLKAFSIERRVKEVSPNEDSCENSVGPLEGKTQIVYGSPVKNVNFAFPKKLNSFSVGFGSGSSSSLKKNEENEKIQKEKKEKIYKSFGVEKLKRRVGVDLFLDNYQKKMKAQTNLNPPQAINFLKSKSTIDVCASPNTFLSQNSLKEENENTSRSNSPVRICQKINLDEIKKNAQENLHLPCEDGSTSTGMNLNLKRTASENLYTHARPYQPSLFYNHMPPPAANMKISPHPPPRTHNLSKNENSKSLGLFEKITKSLHPSSLFPTADTETEIRKEQGEEGPFNQRKFKSLDVEKIKVMDEYMLTN